MPRTAIVVGASGVAGRSALAALRAHDEHTIVATTSRSELELPADRVITGVDLRAEAVEQVAALSPADVLVFTPAHGPVGFPSDRATAEQIAQMEDMVRTRLSPALGYAESGIGLGQVADGG